MMNAMTEELKTQFTRECLCSKKSAEARKNGEQMEAIYWHNQSAMIHNNRVNPLLQTLEGILTDEEFSRIAKEVKTLVYGEG
jgi:hypothetical protein